MKPIAILGEGAWGTAIATVLAHNGYVVNLWCYHKELVSVINKTHCNDRYLPGIHLDKKIIAMCSISQAVCDAQWVFEAIPVIHLRHVLMEAQECVTPQQTWVVLSKGIEQKTLLFPTQMIEGVFGTSMKTGVLAGPSFALPVAQKQITAVTIAAKTCALGESLQTVLANDYFRPYISTDLIGVQTGAALKNVIALAIGMLEGAGYSDNTKAFILTRGLHEMVMLIDALGGQQETAYGLCGVGDLVLTATGQLSRNLEVGRRLGVGERLETILQRTGYIPESINTVKSVYQLIDRYNLSLPICRGIYEIVFASQSLNDFLSRLMAQPLEWECGMKQ